MTRRLAQMNRTGSITVDSGGALQFNRESDPGDSGGAYVLTTNDKQYVIGTHSANLYSSSSFVAALGTYFSYSEWLSITSAVLAGHAGDISSSEPTNMLVGSANADSALTGTQRLDIILARAGNDVLDGADLSTSIWGNDQLFGGTGNDTIKVGLGSDLFYGGDRQLAGSVAVSLANDGVDTVDYSSLTPVDLSKGVRIIIANAAPAATGSTLYAAEANYANASWVVDLDRQKDTDTLVSVENVKLTDADDAVQYLRLTQRVWRTVPAKAG